MLATGCLCTRTILPLDSVLVALLIHGATLTLTRIVISTGDVRQAPLIVCQLCRRAVLYLYYLTHLKRLDMHVLFFSLY